MLRHRKELRLAVSPVGLHSKRASVEQVRWRFAVKRILCKPRQLAETMGDKQAVVDQVAMREPAWFACKAKKPFEPDALHPFRGSRLVARVEVESGTDT
jgi:hypothetical protein